MALVTDSDNYSPGMDESGQYVDQIPSFRDIPQGIRCPCNGNTFCTRASFVAHTKTACHRQWLENHNRNRQNYFQELEQAMRIIHQQKILIAQLEREKNDLRRTIHILSTPMPPQPNTDIDLLEFD
jgi:hypothetical protein